MLLQFKGFLTSVSKSIAPKEILNEGFTAVLVPDNAFVILNNFLVLHSVLVLFQATTLNVAINSNNKALLTIMMSNNVSSVILIYSL
jgi:hypothetical protein